MGSLEFQFFAGFIRVPDTATLAGRRGLKSRVTGWPGLRSFLGAHGPLEPNAGAAEAGTDEEADTTELVRRSRGGDDAAARRLVERLYPLVIRIVRAHRARRIDEEDLAQMVFVRVFARLDQWRASAPFEHWVSRIAVNVCLSQIEYQRVRPEWRMADLGDDQLDWLNRATADSDGDDVARDLAARELVGKLMDAVAPRDRLVLQLLDLEGKSVEDVSRITGWSRTMVKVQAFRARRKMRKLLTRLLEERTP